MKQYPNLIDLDGPWLMEGQDVTEGLNKGFYKRDYTPAEPVKADIPGIVQAALYSAGKIADPYFEDNPERIKWIEDKEWWFFKDAAVPEITPAGRAVLVLEGITYRAELWVNGVNAGYLEGMFKRWFIDITDLVFPGEVNRVTLRIRTQEMASQDYPGSHIGRRVIMSTAVAAPFSYYWNWAPHLVPVGIWKPVKLMITGPVFLRDPYIRNVISWNNNDEASGADIDVSVTAGLQGQENKKYTFKCRIFKDNVPVASCETEQIIIPGEKTAVPLKGRIDNPRLWWPNGMGDQPLYTAVITAEDAAGIVSHRIETEFGIRELKMIRNEDDLWVQKVCGHTNRPWADAGDPYPWTFTINRKRIFVKGTNWLPTDSLFRFSEERYRLFLEQAEKAGINMLRVWGGGIHETETFYRLCDQKGILTWTEFWLACSKYPAMPHHTFIECAADMVKVLRNHPSMVMWSGGNEYNPDSLENKALVDKIETVCRTHDPARPFHRGSPYRGDRHGGLLMLPRRTTNKYGDILEGDSRLVLFRSEIAVRRSPPPEEHIRRFLGKDKVWPPDRKAWEYHHAKLDEIERDAREYGAAGDKKRWLMAGHLTHGQTHRHNMEFCRQNMYRTSGCMEWQLNGSWPSFHRELIDWYGEPKPAFYAYKRSMAGLLILADMEKYVYDGNELFNPGIYAAADGPGGEIKAAVKAVVFTQDMREIYRREEDVKFKEDSPCRLFDLDAVVPADIPESVFFLYLQLETEHGQAAENLYWMGTSPYARPAEWIDLSGDDWVLQYGTEKTEDSRQPGKIPGRPYRVRQPEEGTFELSGGLVEAAGGNESGFAVYYKKSFHIPESFAGTDLEVYSAGLEGDDEIFINGVSVGKTEGKDDRPFQSDPFKTPDLTKVFYPIPRDLVKTGEENTVEVVLSGDNVTGISEGIFIRKQTGAGIRTKIAEYDQQGAYLAGLSWLESTDVSVTGANSRIRINSGLEGSLKLSVRNTGNSLSFLTGFRISGLDGTAVICFSDNYFHLLPGKEKIITVDFSLLRPIPNVEKGTLSLEGWNIKEQEIGTVELEMR
ncbi:MAG: glycosyl hydrolase 2 galactose-binding domain-containing protein [Spirochaetia bacterium]